MTKQVYVMSHDLARQRACEAVKVAPAGWRVTVEEPRKSRDQEERYHAMFGDIARQVPVRGEKRTPEDMKRLLFSAFKIDTQDDPDVRELWAEFGNVRMEPGLRGEIVVFGDQTRRLPRRLASALIEWLFAFGAEHEVVWSEPERAVA